MTLFSNNPLQSTYRDLGAQFYTDQLPTPVNAPAMIRFNPALAEGLNLSSSMGNRAEILQVCAGNARASSGQPIATVYAAHQFGGWNPRLGDGRAILLGEARAKDGLLYDIQLKGSGRTAYSRSGDGRSPLGPVLREYIVSEAMAALGIPTTRALAAVTTGETVVRESALPGAILTRVAQSHIRIGTFQFFSSKNDLDSLTLLADYVIERHFKHAVERSSKERYLALLDCVVQAQARLIAQWMSVGFIHGVMNTDNMLVCGETVDYGPCAFLDTYNPKKVFSSIDQQGRYAFMNQASIGQWNVSWLAQALLPLMFGPELSVIEQVKPVLEGFGGTFDRSYQQLMAEKLGFTQCDGDTRALLVSLLQLMVEQDADYTLTFRALTDQLASTNDENIPDDIYRLGGGFQVWLGHWKALLVAKNIDSDQAYALMMQRNPLYIPRNHWVQAAIEKATREQDFTLFHHMVDTLADPFEFNRKNLKFAKAPLAEEAVMRTFCGT